MKKFPPRWRQQGVLWGQTLGMIVGKLEKGGAKKFF